MILFFIICYINASTSNLRKILKQKTKQKIKLDKIHVDNIESFVNFHKKIVFNYLQPLKNTKKKLSSNVNDFKFDKRINKYHENNIEKLNRLRNVNFRYTKIGKRIKFWRVGIRCTSNFSIKTFLKRTDCKNISNRKNICMVWVNQCYEIYGEMMILIMNTYITIYVNTLAEITKQLHNEFGIFNNQERPDNAEIRHKLHIHQHLTKALSLVCQNNRKYKIIYNN